MRLFLAVRFNSRVDSLDGRSGGGYLNGRFYIQHIDLGGFDDEEAFAQRISLCGNRVLWR